MKIQKKTIIGYARCFKLSPVGSDINRGSLPWAVLAYRHAAFKPHT